MAVNQSGDMIAQLNEGSTDGSYKKVVTDRGGVVDPVNARSRQDLDDLHFGVHEVRNKLTPDGREVTTPNFVPTKPAQYL